MFKSILTYAALAVSATVLFFFLHHLGNQLPYDLAKQRMATAFQEGNLSEAYDDVRRSLETPRPVSALSGVTLFERCQISLMVLGGSQKANDTSLVSAVLLRSLMKRGEGGYCAVLKAVAVDDVESDGLLEKTRYWWGGKALYAIALRYLSIFEINELTKVSIYFAYLLLAIFLLRLAPRMLLIFAPLIVFGFFFSGIRYYPDMVNGLGYLWSVLAAVVLTFLIGCRASLRVLCLFCFIAGMVSSYLWLFDGHTILISSLIALLVYFGVRPYCGVSASVRQAVVCVLIYVVGFLVCFMLGQLIKYVLYELVLRNNGSLQLVCLWGGYRQCSGGVSPLQIPGLKYIGDFWVVGLEGHYLVAKLFTLFAGFAFAGSVLLATVWAYRKHAGVLGDIVFIVGLMVFIWLQFLLPNDLPFRLGRFMFVPHALCWSCLILVVLDWRARRAAAKSSFVQ